MHIATLAQWCCRLATPVRASRLRPTPLPPTSERFHLNIAHLKLTCGNFQHDSNAAICDEPSCQKYFSYFTRRHHCRRCGNIYCDSHSAFEVPLDEEANYNPRGSLSRSCRHCYDEFKSWRARNTSAASSFDPSSNSAILTKTSSLATSKTNTPPTTAGASPNKQGILPGIAQAVTAPASPTGAENTAQANQRAAATVAAIKALKAEMMSNGSCAVEDSSDDKSVVAPITRRYGPPTSHPVAQPPGQSGIAQQIAQAGASQPAAASTEVARSVPRDWNWSTF